MVKFLILNKIGLYDDGDILDLKEIITKEEFITGYEFNRHEELKAYEILINNSENIHYSIWIDHGQLNDIFQISIEINTKAIIENYDYNLEKLKILIKDYFFKIYKRSRCVWLEDKQSLGLSKILYKEINHLENTLRSVINFVMYQTKGVNWWNEIVTLKLQNKYRARSSQFKKKSVPYNNVDDFLLSVDIDDLFSIMNLKQQEWNPKYSEEIEKCIINKELSKLHVLLEEQLSANYSVWNEVFDGIIDSEKFEIIWSKFCEYRNHVAHNKLLNYDAFKEIEEHIQVVKEEVFQLRDVLENVYMLK